MAPAQTTSTSFFQAVGGLGFRVACIQESVFGHVPQGCFILLSLLEAGANVEDVSLRELSQDFFKQWLFAGILFNCPAA